MLAQSLCWCDCASEEGFLFILKLLCLYMRDVKWAYDNVHGGISKVRYKDRDVRVFCHVISWNE